MKLSCFDVRNKFTFSVFGSFICNKNKLMVLNQLSETFIFTRIVTHFQWVNLEITDFHGICEGHLLEKIKFQTAYAN